MKEEIKERDVARKVKEGKEAIQERKGGRKEEKK